MSEEQSITYNTGINSVTVDSAGNLFTDSAGNLVIPIQPITITIESEANHSDCKCAIVRLVDADDSSHTFKPCYGGLPYRQDSVYWLAKSEDIHSVQLVSNLRNVNDETLDFNIVAGIQIQRPPGEFNPSYMQVKIQWGNSSIQSEKYYVCHQGSRTFDIGSISINRKNNTLTYTGSNLPTNASSVQCGQSDEPITITVEAPYSWCGWHYSGFGDANGDSIDKTEIGLAFTETPNVGGGDLCWRQEKNIVVIHDGQSVEEAKKTEALGTIDGFTDKQWITVSYLEWAEGLRFWRDEDKDSEPGSGGWRRHHMYGTWASTDLSKAVFDEHKTGIAFFCTQPPPEGAATSASPGDVYELVGAPNDYADLEYATKHQRKDAPLAEGEFVWRRSTATNWAWPDDRFVHLLVSNRGSTDKFTAINRVLNRTGTTKQLFGDNRYAGTWFKYTTTPIAGYNQITVWLQAEYIGGGFPTNDWAFIETEPNVDGEGWYDNAITAGSAVWLEHKGWRYTHAQSGLLFDLLSYHAWTLSPCHQSEESSDQITVYTDPYTRPEDVTVDGGGEYPTLVYTAFNYDGDGDGEVDETSWDPAGLVKETGTGTYSFWVLDTTSPVPGVGGRSIYYWNGSTKTESIDEEFE